MHKNKPYYTIKQEIAIIAFVLTVSFIGAVIIITVVDNI
jgi:hypothetical protein